MKKFISLMLAAILAVSAFSFASAKTVPEDTRAGFGMSIMGFSTTDLEGNPADSSLLDNAEIHFINYWATWCGPCVNEMPHINQLYQYTLDNPDYGVQVLGVISESNGCTPQTALAFLKQRGYDWLNMRKDNVLGAVFNTCPYVPQTLIVTREGRVLDHIVGSFPSYAMLKEYVDMWLDAYHNHMDETCTVTFKNLANDEVLATIEVPFGGVIEMPEAPAIEGYTFNGWQIDPESNTYDLDENILATYYDPYYLLAMGDCTIYGTYNVQRFLVRFYDSITNNLIGQSMVDYGQAATAPNPPEHEGYVFIGWDQDFSFVTGNMNVYTVYQQGTSPFVPGDMDGNGMVSTADAITILHMAMGLQEITDANLPVADMSGNGSVGMEDAIMALRTALGL
ncbi:MAG: InlB B-repeat-containing protein [Clostridia bacterium]|nr:InlB B-repeat-containing protein [Clostridia bacterium]